MTGLVNIRRPGQKPASESSAPVPALVASAGPADKLAYIETYGCQMNVADSEMVLGMLARAGYARAERPEDAELILINTCAVREKAEDRVYARARALAHHKKRKNVVMGITGCMAEHLKGQIQEKIPQIDMVIGPDGYRRLLQHVDEARSGQIVRDTKLDRHETYEGLDPSREMTGGVTGHISIQRGCDKFCTFCVVPYTRGRERGTPPREILRQARAMAEAGYKEIQLLGQTVNSYKYEDVTFADLLRAVAKIDGIERIRFTSPYPLDFSADVIAAMAAHPNICKHVHMPLQSGSDAVLARMNRGYDMQTFFKLVGDLRMAMPDIGISTDLMVGFCGETDEEFQSTLDAMARIRFDNAFTFGYSEREGTVAWKKIEDDISAEVKQQRLTAMIDLQRNITREKLDKEVGREETVLVESVSKRSNEQFLARTDTYRSVIIPAAPGVQPGALVKVRITGTTTATLLGELL